MLQGSNANKNNPNSCSSPLFFAKTFFSIHIQDSDCSSIPILPPHPPPPKKKCIYSKHKHVCNMGALLNKITAFNVKTWICYLKGINNLILAITLYIEQSVYCDYLVKQVIEQNKLEYLTY